MGTASSTGLSVGAPASTSLNNKSHWKLHLGKLHSTDVSVFRAEGAVAAIAEMAKNSFQRTKQTKVRAMRPCGTPMTPTIPNKLQKCAESCSYFRTPVLFDLKR